MGLDVMLSPLFRIVALDWEAPEERVDALLLTSANAARSAGPKLRRYAHLPCYAVGEATAAAAAEAGLTDVRTGPSDGAALIQQAAADGIQRLLHLCGRDHIPLERPGLTVTRRAVYAAEAMETLPEPAIKALAAGAVPLLHSPRAAAHFARLAGEAGIERGSVRLAAISKAAAEAAGEGWKEVAIAAAPRDAALLELAAELCQSERSDTGKAYE